MAGSENRFERAQALSAAFDPIIDACIRLGVNVRELESLLRIQFVNRLIEAITTSSAGGKQPGHFEVALAAGLDPAEIRRIRSGGAKSAQQRMRKRASKPSKSQKVVEVWRTIPRFLNNSGGPLALTISHAYSGGPTFKELVSVALPHRRHGPVLEELKRLGMVQVTEGIVRLKRATRALPTEFNAQALEHLAGEMKNLGETILKRIEAPQGGDKSLSLFAQSEPIEVPLEQVESARAAMQEQLAEFLHAFARDLGQRGRRPKRVKGKGVVIAASVYTAPER